MVSNNQARKNPRRVKNKEKYCCPIFKVKAIRCLLWRSTIPPLIEFKPFKWSRCQFQTKRVPHQGLKALSKHRWYQKCAWLQLRHGSTLDTPGRTSPTHSLASTATASSPRPATTSSISYSKALLASSILSQKYFKKVSMQASPTQTKPTPTSNSWGRTRTWSR